MHADYYFNLYAIPVGIAAISVLVMGVIVFLQNTRSPINFFFALSCLSVFIWLSGFSIVYSSSESAVALSWFRYYAQLGVVTIGPNIYFFVKALTKPAKSQKALLVVIYSLALIFYATGHIPGFITAAVRYFWGWYPLFGPLSYPYLVFFFALMLAAFHNLWLSQGKMELAIENKRIRIVFIAMLLGYTAALDFIPTFGIGLYPFGYLNIFVWLLLMGYAIVKYNLMRLTPEVVASQIISIIPDFLILVDRGGRIIMVNRTIIATLGYRAEELIKKPVEMIIPQKDTMKLLFEDPEEKGIISNLETVYRSKDGKEIPVIFSRAVVRNDVGDVVGFVITALDITERKKEAENLVQILKAERKNREIITSMLADNNQVREELEMSLKKLKETQNQLIHVEKMEAVGRMASGIAHEVKNPLGIILQGINYFEKAVPPGEKENHEVLRMMKEGVVRADNIIRALLDFSRTEEFNKESQDINSIIETSLDLIGHRIKLNDIELVCELSKDLPKVLADKGKIEQVFVNLLDNAVDAMPKGGKLYIRSGLIKLKEPLSVPENREQHAFKLGEKPWSWR